MVVAHSVWFKFPDSLSEADYASIHASAHRLETIPGVLRVYAGRNFTKRSKFNYMLHVQFKDKAALEAYTPHPVHQEFVALVVPLKEDLAAVDIEDDQACKCPWYLKWGGIVAAAAGSFVAGWLFSGSSSSSSSSSS